MKNTMNREQLDVIVKEKCEINDNVIEEMLVTCKFKQKLTRRPVS